MDTRRNLRITYLDGNNEFVFGTINMLEKVVEFRYQISDDTFGMGIIPFTSFKEVCEV